MSTFVLVHGAWHGGWCWQLSAPMLEQVGHRVLTLDLPGLGDDTTPVQNITLAAYSEAVARVVNAQPEPVILVGHSMGGVAITQAAELLPRK